jgi:hypothetical protein
MHLNKASTEQDGQKKVPFPKISKNKKYRVAAIIPEY